MTQETILMMSSASIKYGFGATREVGFDMKELGAKRVMVVTDPRLTQEEPVVVTLAALQEQQIDAVLYNNVHIEPTDQSLKDAIHFAVNGQFDGFIGVGGGSSIDTAKASQFPDR